MPLMWFSLELGKSSLSFPLSSLLLTHSLDELGKWMMRHAATEENRQESHWLWSVV